MKKLMILAAVAVAASFAQAAKVDWQLTAKDSIKLQDGSGAKGLDVFLINTKASDYALLTADLAKGTATAANLSDYAAYLGTAKTGTTNVAQGKMTAKATASNSGVVAGADVYGVFVAFDSNASGNWYYLSGEQKGKGYDGSDEFPTGTTIQWAAANYSASNWHTVSAVPEPTSGLLLLLGVAGLALRRRRA